MSPEHQLGGLAVPKAQVLLDHLKSTAQVFQGFLDGQSVELTWMIRCGDKHTTSLLAVHETLRTQLVDCLLEGHQGYAPLLGQLSTRRQLGAGRQFAGLDRSP